MPKSSMCDGQFMGLSANCSPSDSSLNMSEA